MARKYINRVVNLEPADYFTVKKLALEKGFGGKGFSAALRFIIREWAECCRRKPHRPGGGEEGR